MIRNSVRLAIVAIALTAGQTVMGEPAPVRSPLLDVFPAPSYDADSPGTTALSHKFTPSVGPWLAGLNERDVFAASMKHTQDESNSFDLRLGVGGQVYSLHGPFGESVPPSWRANGATSPWNDEVWQFVTVCTRYNEVKNLPGWLKAAEPYATSYFIHNSGCYIDAPEAKIKNLYCPLLASEIDPESRSLRQVNWGLVPQMRTIHRSPVLFYTQVRDAGDGVIELTWVVHNFSARDDVVFDHLNAPWGGMRVSNLPLYYASTPDDRLELDDLDSQRFANGIDVRRTGGYAIASAGPGDDSHALGLVYGRDRHKETEQARRKSGEPYAQFKHSLYRSWRANAPKYKREWADFKNIPPASFRNFQVVEIIPKLYLRPQESIWFRSYLVVGTKARVHELSKQLVGHVDYGLRSFPAKSQRLITVPPAGTAKPFGLYPVPIQDALPVFAIRHKPTGKTVYTTDPYHFFPQKKLKLNVPAKHPDRDYYENAVGYTLDSESEFLGLLGYAPRKPPEPTGWLRLSQVAGDRRSEMGSKYDADVWVKTAVP